VKGNEISTPSTPASFNVLINNLKGLGLDVELMSESRPEADEETNQE
jgi:DNA-directed RNA polymerase beta subunit